MKPISRIHVFSPILLVIMFSLVIANASFAETKTFIKEYTFHAGDEDSKNSSRVIALREVKRLLLEELGAYLESTTEVKNFKLTKDQIATLTAGIVQTELIEEKWDGKNYWLQAKITADSDGVIESIDVLRKDREMTKELEIVRGRSEDLLKENKRLRQKLTTINGEKKQQVAVAYKKTVKDLNAVEWYEKGYQAYVAKRYEEALHDYTKAIEIRSDYADAYYARGNVHDIMHNFEQAIRDVTKAIELNNNFVWAYYLRGILYNKCAVLYSTPGNYKPAIRDLTKAIELKSDFTEAYHYRGLIYYALGNYQQAIRDHTKAIEIKPDYADAYESRGGAYGRLGNQQQEIKDYTKAIEIRPDNASTYILRGDTHKELGNYQEAIKDYSKGIELWPDFGRLYCDRGFIYAKLGNYRDSIIDLKVAARLGDRKAQSFLTEQGIVW